MKILVTGGAGYIGSHTQVVLLEEGHEVVCLDNLSNSSPKALERVEALTGKKVPFYAADVRDRAALERVFSEHRFDCVIHFAGLKAVGESVAKPWEYYENNIGGTLTLTDVMRKHGCKRLGHGLRGPGGDPHHGKLPQGPVHQPLRLDQMDAGGDPPGPAYRGREERG